MSVQVEQLTKRYGNQAAVDDLSFSVEKGQILGFLGPNGAGKTTTMKILTCFVPPTHGRATVCGYDVTEAAMDVRRRIGYLPEHNPLYKDMYVKEYLQFVGRLHKLPKLQQRVSEVIERTGLGLEQHKIIGTLSKGYRQRVGLAQAMIHEPEVLILDEPTSGLDPNQLVDIRALIKELGREKTVIFSTHIMQEVQALCDQVLIINRGKLVANDPISALQSRIAGETIVTIELAETTDAASLASVKGVSRVEQLSPGRWKLSVSQTETDVRAEIFRYAVREQLTLLEMHKQEYSVEDVFQRLTQQTTTA